MLRILNEEGFTIKERELMRVRAKNRWLLRVPNGMKARSIEATAAAAAATAATQVPEQAGLEQAGDGSHGGLVLDEESRAVEELAATPATPSTPALTPDPLPDLPAQVLAKRKQRLERLQQESAERWATKRRRRRTRGWAGLPADPPGPPRFPSETTIDESKRYLSLDNAMYRQTREHFQRICEEEGFIKKTIAGPEKWQAAKDRMIQESPHLQAVFWGDPTQLESKVLALDVVCTDVTKRMRTLERRMTIAEAKNILRINPEESRQLRNAFYDTLKLDHFTSKLEAGDEHWKELKQQWIQGSELLLRILAPGTTDPTHANKLKAIEVLCRDVMKRLRDDQAKSDPARKRESSAQKPGGGGSGIAEPGAKQGTANDNANDSFSNGISTLASQALASAPMISGDSDMQIDPSLLQAANDPSFGVGSNHQQPQSQPQQQHTYDSIIHPALAPTPICIQLHPLSPQLYENPQPWLDKLSVRSLNELRHIITSKVKNSDSILRIEGIEVGDNNHEMALPINGDNDLDAYLSHMQGREANFSVLLR